MKWSGDRSFDVNLKFMNSLTALLVIGLIGVSGVAAQVRKPSKAIKPYVVKTKQDVAAIQSELRSIDKDIRIKETVSKTEELIGGEGMEVRVAIQYDAKKSAALAEVHDASDDVYYVLEGSAQLTLGGELQNPREASPGEWRGDGIVGGMTFTIRKGDLIVVPRGTPHHRVNAPGKKFTLILIKVFEDPIKPVK